MAFYTVLGGKGFIGSEVVQQLRSSGVEVFVPEKEDKRIFERNLGTVIYCVGHGDCKNNPFKVFDSNVFLLITLLKKANFDRLIYISSTRLYMNQTCSNEDSDLTISNIDERKLFNLTKLTAEEMCLKSRLNTCIVRPSNVYGLALNSPLFLPAITRDAINLGVVNMYVRPSYEKDYVSVLDVAEMIIKISKKQSVCGEIYNIASGVNVSAEQIANILQRETGCKVNWHPCESNEQFPVVSINKIREEFRFSPRNVLEDLKSMINDFKKVL
ncbi:NAD-dependent epimerase/dehydratase family protein [Shewanella sedimentimangrovi]|uniref:NAD(P)-dependent oxidoreductase n=1 Tax=Shewanella sedimentimangrovi TaxID=2814293 RepID=A0ABX7QYM5_9GAMM|nr:NAD(P)-dependent oxidoreductase [Shewanella sedimentimangrovi]QSX36041.1 NAD(P)-dependent oxidoreductase [Shewanella sedimentimangrovi]